jgi:hypothetical protein
MTRRRTFLIGLCLAAQMGAFWAGPTLAQGLPIWAAAREPAVREAARDDEAPRGQPVIRGGPAPAASAPAPAPVQASASQARPRALSMEAVLDIVKRRMPGERVGGPTPQGSNYVVRWKTPDGHIIDVVVDAVTGAVR